MTPYADFLYFSVALYILAPVIVLGWQDRLWRYGLVFASILILAIQYSAPFWGTLSTVWQLAAYGIMQWGVARLFLAYRAKNQNRFVFYAVMFAGLLPLLGAKFVSPLLIHYPFVFLGLSYLTFRSLDVIFGIEDGVIKNIPFVDYSLYVFFLPTISSGPIDRFLRFQQDWKRHRTWQDWLSDLDAGVAFIFRGFLYNLTLEFVPRN